MNLEVVDQAITCSVPSNRLEASTLSRTPVSSQDQGLQVIDFVGLFTLQTKHP